jgi:adenosine deaminase
MQLSRSDIAALPKIELHLHLDNSISYEGLRRLKPSVTEDEYRREYVAPMPCANLNQFLSCAPRHLELFQRTEALQILVDDVFQQLQRDGVVYAELRFAPLLHTARGLSAESVVATVVAETNRLVGRTGIHVGLILCTLRHFTASDSARTVRLVEQFRGGGVVGFDIAGDEAGFPVQPHVEAFSYAHDLGLAITAHAGEARGPESVWETLALLRPTRIGHGVRSAEDPRLVQYLRDKRVHLEVCPSSNVQIVEAIKTWPQHPIGRLYEAGVSLSVNTDTRTLTPTTLTNEYLLLQEHLRWAKADFLAANLSALESAFVGQETKNVLRTRLQDAYVPTA